MCGHLPAARLCNPQRTSDNGVAAVVLWELVDHPPCSPDLVSSDFDLIGPLKQQLGGRQLHSNGEVEMAVGEWLRVQEPDCYRDGIFKLVPKWDKCINVLGEYVKKL
jgi:hypothetical protein